MNELAEQCGGENLSSFLIKPVQRLLRYKLLMRDVFKCTDRRHQDYEPMKAAIDKLQVVSLKVDEAAGLLDDKSKLESSKSSPTNQRRRRHRRMISRQIDEEGEDWKRLSSRSLKMSRASVVPTVSASVRLPPGLPPSPPKTQSPDERTRLRSVVTNISSKSDLKVSRASVAPTMSVRIFHHICYSTTLKQFTNPNRSLLYTHQYHHPHHHLKLEHRMSVPDFEVLFRVYSRRVLYEMDPLSYLQELNPDEMGNSTERQNLSPIQEHESDEFRNYHQHVKM